MSEIIQIEWTAGSIDEARKVSRYLVQAKLIAAAEIIPWIEKIALLDGQLETTQESKVSFIAEQAHFETISKVIKDNSSYQIPEITYRSFLHVDDEYQTWITHHGSK